MPRPAVWLPRIRPPVIGLGIPDGVTGDGLAGIDRQLVLPGPVIGIGKGVHDGVVEKIVVAVAMGVELLVP